MTDDDPTSELAAWLDSCLTEMEQVARTAAGPYFQDEANEPPDLEWTISPGQFTDGGGFEEVAEARAPHMSLHDPRAVLARVAAERVVLATWRDAHWRPVDRSTDTDLILGTLQAALDTVIARLAYGHRHDHPGYQPAWTPDGTT